MNIVFSTTRQWNPGDEIILFGCQNLLRRAGFDFNPIIFNRNPQIRPPKHSRGKRWLQARLGPQLDNSIKDGTNLSFADVVVFAGSPRWRGRVLRPLYQNIIKHGLPTLFLGLGTSHPFSFGSEDFSEDEMTVMKQALLITCRDSLTAKSLAPLPVRQLPCPALLSCESGTLRNNVRRVGLIFGSDRAARHNSVSAATYRYLHALYSALIAAHGNWQFELVAHYIDELPHAASAFPGIPLRYSYDARDYARIYDRYDLVIGHRVHGIGVAASQGIPGLCISHDERGETVRGFGAELVADGTSIEKVCELADQMATNLGSRSQALLVHKEKTSHDYAEAINAALRSSTLSGHLAVPRSTATQA